MLAPVSSQDDGEVTNISNFHLTWIRDSSSIRSSTLAAVSKSNVGYKREIQSFPLLGEKRPGVPKHIVLIGLLYIT